MQSFRINVLAMVNASLEAIPWLKKSDQARIINIASLAARQIGKFLPHHAATKAAMLVASKQLANILGKDNILVNAICPGTLHGEPWERGVKNLSEHLHITMEEAAIKMEEDERAKTALGRVGAPQDVARLATFLASNYANWITGASYTIDGGASRSV
jgi:3-oxoacyl-[acyl-carrier protein] reductase